MKGGVKRRGGKIIEKKRRMLWGIPGEKSKKVSQPTRGTNLLKTA